MSNALPLLAQILDFFDVRDGALVGHGVGGDVDAIKCLPFRCFCASCIPRLHSHPVHAELSQACQVEDRSKVDIRHRVS